MRTLLIFSISLIIFTVPIVSIAAIVPCDGVAGSNGEVECQACHVVELGQRLLTWFISIMAAVIALVFVIGGLKMVMAGGNEGEVTKARSMMTSAIIGFIILLASWLIVDTVMKTFMKEGALLGPWNEIECTIPPPLTGAPSGPPPPPVPGEEEAACDDDAALIAKYSGSPVGQEAPGLSTMISCYRSKPGVADAIDASQIYTVDQTYPRCSLTNGNQVCGSCSHSVNSTHYGRGSGQGAMAVDFNARSDVKESDLFNLLKQYNGSCGGTILYESDHTHISL